MTNYFGSAFLHQKETTFKGGEMTDSVETWAVSDNTIRQIRLLAIDIIKRVGWIQNRSFKHDENGELVGVCASQAVLSAARIHKPIYPYSAHEAILKQVNDAIGVDLIKYNDIPGCTKEEVIKILRPGRNR